MIYTIKPSFLGLVITSKDNDYVFRYKIFSHSAILMDEQSNVIAQLFRSSWWRMKFNLVVGDKHYKLNQRFLESELIYNNTMLRYHTNAAAEFFRGALRVTQIEESAGLLTQFRVNIRDENHALALLMATCSELSLIMAQ